MTPVSWAYVLAAANGVFAILALSLAAGVYFFAKTMVANEMSRMSNILPGAMDSLCYAEIPIQVVALICGYMKISLADMTKEYKRDAMNRRSIVLQTFRKDPVTMAFIEAFQSKFIQHGYVGEELLVKAKL